jgi:hypothetical protein
VPVFLLWPSRLPGHRPSRYAGRRLLARTAVAVVAASIASGGVAFVQDILLAFRWAGPSVFTPLDQQQLAEVRAAAKPGETVLLLATRDEAWHAPLWQRALYPERRVIIRYPPFDDAELRDLKKRDRIRVAVTMGAPVPDPGFRSRRDLGHLAGLPSRVWIGELAP